MKLKLGVYDLNLWICKKPVPPETSVKWHQSKEAIAVLDPEIRTKATVDRLSEDPQKAEDANLRRDEVGVD